MVLAEIQGKLDGLGATRSNSFPYFCFFDFRCLRFCLQHAVSYHHSKYAKSRRVDFAVVVCKRTKDVRRCKDSNISVARRFCTYSGSFDLFSSLIPSHDLSRFAARNARTCTKAWKEQRQIWADDLRSPFFSIQMTVPYCVPIGLLSIIFMRMISFPLSVGNVVVSLGGFGVKLFFSWIVD